MIFIDGHTHAYLEKDQPALTGKLTMLDGHLAEDDPHRWKTVHEGSLDRVIESERRAGVERFVLLPVATKPGRVAELNRWTAQAAEDYAEVIPFATLHPLADDPAADLAEAIELGARGVKLHTVLQRFELLGEAALTVVERVAAAGLPLLLDTLNEPGLLAVKPHLAMFSAEFGPFATDPNQIAELARRFPELTIIAAHLGCLYGWDQIEPLLDLDNVYLDTAYVDRLLTPEQAAELIRLKGAERVIWGTDTPWRAVSPAKDWFLSLDLTAAERELIAGKNLIRVLGL